MRPTTEERYPEACQLVDSGKAPPKLARVVALHREGKLIREISELTGWPMSTIGELLRDPHREMASARKHRFDGVCTDCGSSTRGDGSRSGPPKRCRRCAGEYQHRTARKRLLDALDDWVIRYGVPPSAWDWNLPMALPRAHPETLAQLLKRHRDRKWPCASSVQNAFGSWNTFMVAGGYTPRAQGQRADPDTWRRHRFEKVM